MPSPPPTTHMCCVRCRNCVNGVVCVLFVGVCGVHAYFDRLNTVFDWLMNVPCARCCAVERVPHLSQGSGTHRSIIWHSYLHTLKHIARARVQEPSTSLHNDMHKDGTLTGNTYYTYTCSYVIQIAYVYVYGYLYVTIYIYAGVSARLVWSAESFPTRACAAFVGLINNDKCGKVWCMCVCLYVCRKRLFTKVYKTHTPATSFWAALLLHTGITTEQIDRERE